MNPLESRKHLLIAESEISRVRIQEEWQAMTDGMRSHGHRARSFGSIASAAVVLVAGLAAFRRRKPGDATAKASWGQTILKGAGLIPTLWLAFRSKRRDQTAE